MITEEFICHSGLYPYLPWQLDEYPAILHEYCGKGMGLWQYPNQFAPYINKVLSYKPRTYLEIGVGAGGTFMFTSAEILKQEGKSCFAVDVAPPGEINYINNQGSPFAGKLASFLSNNDKCYFHKGTSETFLSTHKEDIDYVLIDGDHTYDGAKKDWLLVEKRAKIIGFHDIVNIKTPGVCKLWEEIKSDSSYYTYEFTDQYGMNKNYLGLGLVIKK